MNKNLLVTLADKNYIEQAKQLFSSAHFKAQWSGDYMLLAYNLKDDDLLWFKKNNIKILKCKKIPNKIKGKNGNVTLCKLYIFTNYFKKWNNVVYLDSDIIIKQSIDKAINLADFSAVPDSFLKNRVIDQLIHPKEINKDILNKLKNNFNINNYSFNSGFFIINTDIIKNNTFSKLKKILYEYQEIFKPWNGDQSVLNLYFNENWNKLPTKYNVDYRDFKHLHKNLLQPVILHFNVDEKPWHKNNKFNYEWLDNLSLAEKITIKHKNPVSTGNGINNSQIILYILFYMSIKNITKSMDKKIGAIGRYLYFKNNYIYNKLLSLSNSR